MVWLTSGSKEVCKRVGIPYALVCTPMAEPEEQEIDVQLCNFGKRLPPRYVVNYSCENNDTVSFECNAFCNGIDVGAAAVMLTVM